MRARLRGITHSLSPESGLFHAAQHFSEVQAVKPGPRGGGSVLAAPRDGSGGFRSRVRFWSGSELSFFCVFISVSIGKVAALCCFS